jgi:hypothetical protein
VIGALRLGVAAAGDESGLPNPAHSSPRAPVLTVEPRELVVVASGGGGFLVPRSVSAVVGRLLGTLDAAAADGVTQRALPMAAPTFARGHALRLLQDASLPTLLPSDPTAAARRTPETTNDVQQAFERFSSAQPQSFAGLDAAQRAYARGAMVLLLDAVRDGELTATQVPAALQLIAAAARQHGQSSTSAAPVTRAVPPPERPRERLHEPLAWNNPKWFGDPAFDDSAERDAVHDLFASRGWPAQSEAAVTRFLHDARLQGLAERLRRGLRPDHEPAAGTDGSNVTASLTDYLMHLGRNEAAFQRVALRNELLDLPLETRVEDRWRQLSLEADNAGVLGPRQLRQVADEGRADVRARLAVRFMQSLVAALDASLFRGDLPQQPLFTPTVEALRELAEPLRDVLELDTRMHARLSYLARTLDLHSAIDTEFRTLQREGAVDAQFVQRSTRLLREQAGSMLRRIDEPHRIDSPSQMAPLLNRELRAAAQLYLNLADTIERASQDT